MLKYHPNYDFHELFRLYVR